MDNGEKKVSNLFDGRTIFNIPKYQRAYTWERSQLTDFVQDIKNQKEDRSYFLGTVLFEEKGLENNYQIIDVVDGQQRITTIIIFMVVLINSLKNNSSNADSEAIEILYETYIKHRANYKLRALEEDNTFFHTYILGSDNGEDYIRTPAQRRLYEAKKYFEEHLSRLEKTELDVICKKIDENSRVLVYSVKDTVQATQIFETTNDRGKGLTNLEKIKSFMMYKSYIASEEVPDQLLNTIRSRFGEIYNEYGRYEDKMDEDSILQYHFIAHQEWNSKEYQQYVLKVKETVNNYISEQDNESALKFIDTYTKELKETFFVAREILNSQLKFLRDIFILSRTSNFWPLLIKTFKLDKTPDKSSFSEVAKLLEIYSFRVYAVNQNRGNTGQSKLYAHARDFSGDYKGLKNSLIMIISEYSTDSMFKSNLSDPYIYERMNTRDLSYFFWKYENSLREFEQPVSSPMSESEFITENTRYQLTIEHIASQNPKESIVNERNILPEINDEFKEKHLHSIGNLTIDPQSANSSKGNKDFDYKNQNYFVKAPFKTQNELEKFLIEEQWSKESIDRRKDVLIKFALKYWDVRNTIGETIVDRKA